LVWDSKGATERHEIYKEYKATRDAAPSDLFTQKDLIQEFADLINLHQVAEPGIEADDLMASIAQDYAKQGYTSIIITSDKDMRQAVSEHIKIYDPFFDKMLDVHSVEERYGFSIAKLPFYFALIGDSSDNIPGVRGIGPKGATKLVQEFDSLEDLYESLEDAGTARTQMLLTENKENAFLSEKLFLLRYKKTNTSLESLVFSESNYPQARPLFERLHFKSLVKELAPGKEEKTEQIPDQLFADRYGYNFITVATSEQLDALCSEILQAGACALDTETDSLRPLESTLVGISLCYAQGSAYYIPLAHITDEIQLSLDEVKQKLGPVLADNKIKKYLHSAKFDHLVLYHAGFDLQGIDFDTVVAAGLLKVEGDKIGLKTLSEKYFNERMFTYKQMVTEHKLKNFAQVPLKQATDYAAADAHQTYKLVPLLQEELKKQGQEKLYYDIELPLINVLYEMEKTGVLLDPLVLVEIDKKVSHKLAVIVEKIGELTGKKEGELNLNSPKQIANLLFEELGLAPIKKTAKGTGHSTNQEVLEELARKHPVPGLIVQYRELFKLKSTYIDALPTCINPETGRIHTTYNQFSVATGRLSSTDPNLQNIPTDNQVASIRKAFEAAEGRLFISADYSQMELRVLAELSQDKTLIHAFKSGEDIHARTAAGLFDVDVSAVNHEQRQLAKRINFSILYGLTPYGLSKDLHISMAQAKEYIDIYMAHYPGVSAWMIKVEEETKKHGYVITWYGRRRYLLGIYEKNKALYALARRVAINTKAQGTAAEVMKLGMLYLQQVFAKQLPDAQLILQIHDELIISVPEADVTKAKEIVQKTLESVVHWSVPLEVDVRQGKTWHDVSK
jgi:DNA polymerase-1